MPDKAVLDLLEFLAATNDRIKRIEAEGEAVIQTGGQAAFQAKLEEKARILAALHDDAWELVEAIDGQKGDVIARRLGQSFMSASTALRIGSVLFMTALLYPDDHRPGEPNDLEVFMERLRAMD